MKILKNIVYVVVIALLLSSCIKDEGTNTYTGIPGVDFSNMPISLDAIQGEQLTIDGDIVTSLPLDDLEFAWYRTYSGADLRANSSYNDTISIEKDLDILLSDAPGTNITYYYSVYDTKNEVHYVYNFSVTIVTPFTMGWAILTNRNDSTDMDFISYVTNTTYTNVLSNITGVDLDSKPVQFDFPLGILDGVPTGVILAEEDAISIDGNNMVLEDNILEDRFNPTTFIEQDLPVTGGFFNQFTSNMMYYVIATQDHIYPKGGWGVDASFWAAYIQGDYEVGSNFCAIGYYKVVFFDSKNRRYLILDPYDLTSVTEITSTSTAAFDPNDLQKDVLWIGVPAFSSSYGQTNVAFLKDDAGNYFFQKFDGSFLYTFDALSETQVEAGKMDENSVFVANRIWSASSGCPTYPYIYFTKGNVIHRYNLETDAFDYDYLTLAGGDVKMMRLDLRGETMAVVTDNGDGSRITLIDLLDNGNVLATYDTENRAVDLVYRENATNCN